MISTAARQRRREKRELAHAERERALISLRAHGKTCSNCQHVGRAPFPAKGCICELDSDSEGYVIVELSGLCVRHASAGDKS